MFELSTEIYNLLNVDAITSVATGGIAPILAENRQVNFVNYTFGALDELSKDNRVQLSLTIDCYGNDYNKTLQIFDAVNQVLQAENYKLVNFESSYLFTETNDCVASGIFNIRKKK